MDIKNILERLTRQTVTKKALAIFFISTFLASILPLLILSFYNRPAADDFSYSVFTVHAWRETGSIFQVLAAAFQTVQFFFIKWQGTFSAVFLFSLQPAIYGDHLYFLTTFLMLGMLIASTSYLLHVLLVQHLKADRWTWIIVSTLVLFLSIQLIPNPNEAFYWYNGSVYYTFFYSAMLFMVGMILKLLMTSSSIKFVFRSIGIILLAIFISGGNYATALISCLLLTLFSVFLFVRKQKSSWIVASALILSLAGLLVSGLAPGNAIRVASLIPMGPVEAIIESLYNGVILISQWTSLVIFAALMLLFPLIKDLIGRVQFSFKYPGLVLLGSYALFSAQLTPAFFAMSDLGAGRQMDLYYFTFILLIVLNFIYLVGWLNKKAFAGDTLVNEKSKTVSFGFLLLVALVGLIGLMNHGVIGLKALPTMSALISLIKGDAQTFASDMDARVLLFENPAIMDVTVTSLSVIPPLFHAESVTANASIWPNVDIARYYDKNSVVLLVNPSERFSLLICHIKRLFNSYI